MTMIPEPAAGADRSTSGPADPAAHSYSPSAPEWWDPDSWARRVYFSNLVPVMFIKGFDADAIGRVVAELDDHLVMSGTDPVQECGQVGKLANDLVASPEHGTSRTLRWIQALRGVAVVTATTLLVLLVTGWSGQGSLTIEPQLVVLWTALYVLVPLLRWWNADRVTGRRLDEWRRPGWKAAMATIPLLVAVAPAPWVLE